MSLENDIEYYKQDNMTNETILLQYGNRCSGKEYKEQTTMNNDLISREALKKKIDEVQYTKEFCIEHQIDYSISMQMLGMIIDNAPTVVIDEEIERQREELYQSSKKLFDTARMLGVERPQGEWKETDIPESTLCKCSVCGFDLGAYSFNFCPNCGSAMKGGTQ